MSLSIRKAAVAEMNLLAHMNKQLIDDEGSGNPMSIDELEERMRAWFLTDWTIDLLIDGQVIVGYALYQFRASTYDRNKQEVYIRHYFIRKEFRNQGFGQAGITLLMEEQLQAAETIIIDVLECNPKGMNFWRKVGFTTYSVTMKRKHPH